MSAAFVIFFLSIALILYVLIGYPALLAAYARIRPKFIQKELSTTTRLSIIIPVRNGASWIAPKLKSLLASEYPHPSNGPVAIPAARKMPCLEPAELLTKVGAPNRVRGDNLGQ